MYSLHTKIAFPISVLAVILILIMTFFMLYYFEATTKATIAGQSYATVGSMAREIDNKFATAQDSLVAASKAVPAGVFEDEGKARQFMDACAGMSAIFGNNVYLFSKDGRIIAWSAGEQKSPDIDFSLRKYLESAVETPKPYISTPYISGQNHHPVLVLTAPVFDNNGELAGILSGVIDLMQNNFLGTLPLTRIGNNGYLYLCDTNRLIVAHPDAARILQQDTNSKNGDIFSKAMQGSGGSVETIDARGVAQLTVFKPLTKINWILVANYPLAEVYKPITAARRYFIPVGMLSIGILVFAGWVVVKKKTNPLRQFTSFVESLPDKHGDERYSNIPPGDEIGALSTAFNKMLRELDKKTQSLENSKELYKTVTDFASDMTFWRSCDGPLFYISPNCERLTGYKIADFYSRPNLLDDIVHVADREKWQSYIRRAPSATFEVLEFRVITNVGNIRWVSCASRHVFDKDGRFQGIRGSHQDITERKLAENRIHFISFHDPLTGFRNRASFENELDSYNKPELLPLTIFVCDVDGLKLTNDTLGHNSGDEVLRKIAKILTVAFTPLDGAIYRIGGDEFVIVLCNFRREDAERRYRRLVGLIGEYNEQDGKLPVSISAGFAVSDGGQVDMVALFKEADNAMYREKLHHQKSVRSTAVQALMKALEARDFQTEGHAGRLHEIIGTFGRQLGLSEKILTELRLLAQFHDIGKVGIPDKILFKPDALTMEERKIIQRHPEIGYRIAASTPDLTPIADLILKHHEWWNGTGYPLGLKGDEIPLECRVLAIVDAYDAMTSDRPYRSAMSHQAAINELKNCAGTQFDPRLVLKFVDEFKLATRKTDRDVKA